MSQTSHLRVNVSASGDAERPQLGIGAPEGQKSGSPPARSPASSQQGGRGWVLEAAAGGARVAAAEAAGPAQKVAAILPYLSSSPTYCPESTLKKK